MAKVRFEAAAHAEEVAFVKGSMADAMERLERQMSDKDAEITALESRLLAMQQVVASVPWLITAVQSTAPAQWSGWPIVHDVQKSLAALDALPKETT